MMNYTSYAAELGGDLRIAYLDEHPSTTTTSKAKGVIMLIHGFPQTSYQFRKVIPGLTSAG
jgi:pimeloyl-ACP methyl ester carboxylesterase